MEKTSVKEIIKKHLELMVSKNNDWDKNKPFLLIILIF